MENKALRFDHFCCALFTGHGLTVTGEILSTDRVVLRGPSGCGKSTFLKYIAGLYPARSGKLFLDETELNLTRPQISRPGLVFQGGALFDHLSVYENCKIALDYNPQYLAWSEDLKKKLIQEKLVDVGLENCLTHRAHQLSGGERQRAALVRCFLSSPHFLLLDEPLSALDPKLRQSLQQQILNLLAKNPLPTLIVTHDETEAAILGTKIIEWPKMDSSKTELFLQI